uniref:Cilia- and flagella-associated protein 43 n=1 Tax=Schistosoma mansoni TaxID=6183 RepID=A0A3Q0KL58_SCHMA
MTTSKKMKMTFEWVQGLKKYQFGFLGDHVLCIKCGPSIKFHDILTNKVETLHSPTKHSTGLSIHPLEPYFSVTELCNVNPKVYIYKYPQKEENILKNASKLEIQQSIFSHTNYYATVSGIPDFILSIWNFHSCEILCKTNLNGLHLTTFSFCPTDWHYLLGTDHHCAHVWQIETCDQMNSIKCNSMILPEHTVNLGPYYGSHDTKINEDTTGVRHETRFDPNILGSSITGLNESREEEFDDYMDKCVRLNCVSQTWTNSKLVFIGCEGGQLLLFDPISMNLKILLNPASHCQSPKESSLINSEVEIVNRLEGCLTYLLYTTHGLLTGGRDGILRLLILTKTTPTTVNKINPLNKQSDQLSVKVNEASSVKIGENYLFNTEIQNCINLYNFENLIQNDRYHWGKNITSLSISSSYRRIAVSCRLGYLSLFSLHDSLQSTLSPDKEIFTNCDRFVGMGLITSEKSTICVTAGITGIINCWDCKTGELIGSLFLNDTCHCLVISPVLPLAVAGMNSGSIMFIDFTSPTSPRIVNIIRLYRKPLTHIAFDPDGEFLTAVIDNGPSILMSALPTKSFEPIGYVSFIGRVHNLSMIRSKDSSKIFVLLAVSNDTNKTAEAIYQYEIPAEIGSNNEVDYVDNYRKLNEDKINLIKWNFHRPKVGVCYWPSNDVYESTSPLIIAADSQYHALEIFCIDESQKKQHQLHITTEYIYNILQESKNIKFTRISGTNSLLAYSMDGSVQIININETVSLQYSINIHESNSRGIIAAEFCKDLNSLITCGGDGLLARVKIREGAITESKVSSFPSLRSLHEQLTKLQEMKSCEITQNQSHLNANILQKTDVSPILPHQSGTSLSLYDQQISVDADEDTDLEEFSYCKRDTDSNVITWIEFCQLNAEASENLIYGETKTSILNELNEIRNTVNAMVSENESLPEFQRIDRLEFELDVDEQNVILEKTKKEVNQLRKEIKLKDLAKQFTWQAIKSQCWDEMFVKGRCLKAFNLPIKVSNYPLKNITSSEKQLINTVVARMKIIHTTAKERELLSSHLFQSNISKKPSQEQKEEVDEEEEPEQSINRILVGSTAREHGGSIDHGYCQMDLYTRMQKIYQIVLVKNAIYRMKESFNKQFDEVYEKKASHLANIQTKLSRIRKIHTDLQQPHLLKHLTNPKFDPDEEPEQLFIVTDDEITVEKYFSPEKLAEIQSKRLADEERRRKEKLDNWREKGLEEMMGGVLEITKEDELKKDIPKPAFLLTGKPSVNWTEDDKQMYAEYERKVKELNEEREKYKKFLEGDLKKIYNEIDEIKEKFDEELTTLFNKWLHVQVAILQEELKIWRLKWMLLTEEEFLNKEYELKESINELYKKEVQITKNLETAKSILDQIQEETELLSADDKLMEKNLRKEFSDIHGVLYDFIVKAYKKRPKHFLLAPLEKKIDQSGKDTQSSKQLNPYIEKICQSTQSTKQTSLLEESLVELDNDPSHEQQPGCDNALWSRLCAARRRKINKELEIKFATQKLDDITNFIRKRDGDLQSLHKLLEERKCQLNNLIKDYNRNQTDLELQLLIKQGFVEVNINQSTLLHDYNDALLIQREQVEELNKQIIILGESINGFMLKKLELSEMLMRYEDLQTKLGDIRRFKITSEIRKYLQSNDYDSLINTQITNTERTIQMLQENHEKTMAQKLARLRHYEIYQDEKLKKENEKAKKEIEELNVVLHETKFIHEQNHMINNQLNNPQLRHKLLIQHQNIMKKIKEQNKELKILQTELNYLRQQKSNLKL